MTTLSKKMLGYALGRTVLASDRPLIGEMAAAGGSASFSDLAVEDRDQPAVPEPQGDDRPVERRREWPIRRIAQDRGANRSPIPDADPDHVNRSRYPMSIDHLRHPSRRHFLRGMGVALALPWMESLPRARPGRGRGEGEHAAAAARHRLLLERRRADSLVGQGQRRRRWSSVPALLPMMPHREDMVFIQGLYNQAAFVSTSPHLGRMNVLSGAPVSLDPNVIRVGTSMDQVLAVADRQPHGDPEPRARHRAERAAPRGRPVDDLRLERVVGLADQAGDEGDLSLAHVRSPGRRRHRPQARSQHPRRGAAGLAEPASRRSAAATTSS